MTREDRLQALFDLRTVPDPPADLRRRVLEAVQRRQRRREAPWASLVHPLTAPRLAAAFALLLFIAGGFFMTSRPDPSPLDVAAGYRSQHYGFTASYEAPTQAPSPADPLAALSEQVGFAVHLPEWLPPSFRLVAARAALCPCGRPCGEPLAQLLFSDGRDWISVFEGGAGCRQRQGDMNCPSGASEGCVCRRAGAPSVVYRNSAPAAVAVGDRSEQELARIVGSVPAAP